MDRPFFTYMLRCSDGSYYVGHTDDLPKRIAEHQHGQGCAWTRARLPVEHVWSQEFSTREEAKSAEQQIKRWSRAKKQALIGGDFDLLKLLASRSKLARAALRFLRTSSIISRVILRSELCSRHEGLTNAASINPWGKKVEK